MTMMRSTVPRRSWSYQEAGIGDSEIKSRGRGSVSHNNFNRICGLCVEGKIRLDRTTNILALSCHANAINRVLWPRPGHN